MIRGSHHPSRRIGQSRADDVSPNALRSTLAAGRRQPLNRMCPPSSSGGLSCRGREPGCPPRADPGGCVSATGLLPWIVTTGRWVANPEELRPADRRHSHMRRRPLENPVPQRRHARRSLPSILLGYACPSRRRRPVYAVGQSAFPCVPVHLPCHGVHALSSQGTERFAQNVEPHMVEQCHRTFLRIPQRPRSRWNAAARAMVLRPRRPLFASPRRLVKGVAFGLSDSLGTPVSQHPVAQEPGPCLPPHGERRMARGERGRFVLSFCRDFHPATCHLFAWRT